MYIAPQLCIMEKVPQYIHLMKERKLEKVIDMLSRSPQLQQEKEDRKREIQNTVCIPEKHQQRAKRMEQGAGHSAVKPAESSETPSGGDSYRMCAS